MDARYLHVKSRGTDGATIDEVSKLLKRTLFYHPYWRNSDWWYQREHPSRLLEMEEAITLWRIREELKLRLAEDD